MHTPTPPGRRTLARARPAAVALLAALTLATAASVTAEVRDRALLAGAGSPASRALALERLAPRDPTVLLRALEHEPDALVRERALTLAPTLAPPADVARILALRLDRAHPGQPPLLVDLRAAGAQGDARALGPLARILGLRGLSRTCRAAALTAVGAISSRRGLPFDRIPWTRLEATTLCELACSLDEDAAPWRVALVRALARRLPLDARGLDSLRRRASLAPGPDACSEPPGALDLLLVRGDRPTLLSLSPEHEDRAGLLAPVTFLLPAPSPADLDRLFALDSWGGRGAWRRLAAGASRSSGRSALLAALSRLRGAPRPAAVAAAVLLAREDNPAARAWLAPVACGSDPLSLWARAALGSFDLDDPSSLEALARDGTLEALPPPLVEDALHRGRAGSAAALARAVGRPDGSLAFVLEPGGGPGSHAFLTDLAIEAFSTAVPRER